MGGHRYGKDPAANLDGTGVEDLVSGLSGNRYGIALDISGGKMYWTNREDDSIQREHFDGSGVDDLITGLSNIPNGIALGPDFVLPPLPPPIPEPSTFVLATLGLLSLGFTRGRRQRA